MGSPSPQLTQRQAVRAAVRRAASTPGARLPNGAIIIAQQFVGDPDGDRGEAFIVLAINVGGTDPYVTWKRVIGIGERATGGWHDVDYTYQGHYHRTIDEAVQDYQARQEG